MPRIVWLQPLVPAVVLVAACVRPAPAFVCAESAQCSGGICQTTGFCSFADSSCATGQRYGSASGDLGGLCVGTGSDAGAGTGSDGGSGGDPPPCDQAQPFGTPVLVAGLASSAEDASLRLSPDEKTAYFFSARPGNGKQLLYTASRARVSDPFGSVTVLDNVNGNDSQYNPAITANGLDLFFASYRAGGDNEIYQATRSSLSGSFTNVRLAPNVNTTASEVQPYVTRDGSTMYFVRNVVGSGNTVFRAVGSANLGFINPSLVSELDGPTNDTDPVPSMDNLTMYWASDRADGGSGSAGDVNIWVAHRSSTTAQFTGFTPVSSVNSVMFDAPSDVSADDCRLYITSMRDGKTGIYMASRPPRASSAR